MNRAVRAACAAAFVAFTAVFGTVVGAQTRPATDPAGLAIGGDAAHPLTLTTADLDALPHEHLDVVDDDKSHASYDGVELHVLLERAGVRLGEAMRGQRLLDYVVVTAADGYRVVFSLAELDPAFVDRRIILAYRRNGTAIDIKHGPLRLIVPDESRHARWIREVTSISVTQASIPSPIAH